MKENGDISMKNKLFLIVLVVMCMITRSRVQAQAQTTSSTLLSKSPQVLNVLMATADTETPLIIPKGVNRIRITPRGGDIKYSWKLGGIDLGVFSTIIDGSCYCNKDIALSAGGSNDTLYMEGSVNGVVAEIEVWR